MKFLSIELLKEFYEREKGNYPTLNFQQTKDICYGPWRFLKHEMENKELPTVRIKYFGVFQVYEGRAKFMLKIIKKNFEKGLLRKDKYLAFKNMIENFLKK